MGGVFTKNCIIDSGSSESFICSDFAERLKLPIEKSDLQRCRVTVATTDSSLNINGSRRTTIQYSDHWKFSYCFGVVDKLCADVILGHDIWKRPESLHIKFGGPEAQLKVSSVASAAIDPPPLCETLRSVGKPNSGGFRNYPETNRKLIAEESLN